MDSRKCQTATATPPEAGDLLISAKITIDDFEWRGLLLSHGRA